mmetsp:Transcript_23377/g.32613  ORF Transcript_23377/g.32613 Transcript_23377/m.32613 type:complete len:224 (+) Transcript_23377:50-721(+)
MTTLSQTDPKSLEHISSFYTSFDTIATLNARLRDKYGVDLSSVEFKSPDIQNINATYENAMSASGTVGENAKINDGIEEVGGNGNEDIPGNEQAGAPQEAREDSAIQRAAMFEQTWQSNIPSEKVVLQTRPQAPPISDIDGLRLALAHGRMTLVASGETNGHLKAYFYKLASNRAIVLFELVAEVNQNDGKANEYNLLCKFTERDALDEVLDTISVVLDAEVV